MFAAFVVTILYWIFGVGLQLFFFMQFASSLNFFWFDVFRPAFYIPGIIIVIYIYYFKKDRGLFSESLAFLLAGSLAIFWTLELIIFI